MSSYLTIPGVADAEELVSAGPGMGTHSFVILVNIGDTAAYLYRVAADYARIPSVVMHADATTIHLDDVIVTSTAADHENHASFTLEATAVHYG